MNYSIAWQAPVSMGFPRKKYWSGLPFPSSGDLPDPEIEPVSPALAGRFFTTKSYIYIYIKSLCCTSENNKTLCVSPLYLNKIKKTIFAEFSL